MYLITGGAGFIGSHLAHRLLNVGHRVRIVDDLSTGRRDNLAGIADEVELVEGDIRDPELMAAACRGVDVVLHQAALPSVPRSVADPRASLDANVMGTLNVLESARDAGVRRVVQASSSSVYGDTPVLPKTTAMRPQPRSPYAVAKLAAETLGQAFTASYGLEVVALRYFNVFGPRQDPDSAYAAVIPRFIAAVRDDRDVTIHGDGEQSRDFTYVDNVVDANLRAARAEGAGGQVFNVATGQAVSVNAMLATICGQLGRPARVVHEPPRVGDVRDSLADWAPAAEVLGYAPAVGFEEGIRRTIASLLAAPPSLIPHRA
ncbi:SDR family oxidoreductase [Nocardioides ginsengisoli]